MPEFEITHSGQVGGPSGMQEVVAYFQKLNGATGWGAWEVDQVLFLHFILSQLHDKNFQANIFKLTLWPMSSINIAKVQYCNIKLSCCLFSSFFVSFFLGGGARHHSDQMSPVSKSKF